MNKPQVSEALTPRVARLRARLASLEPEVAVPAWGGEPPPYLGREPFHEAWLAHEGDPFGVRLAHAQAAWRAAVQPRIPREHLVVGTPPPRTIISYHTGTFAWGFVLNESFATEHPEGEAIVAYWREWLAAREMPTVPDCFARPRAHDALWVNALGCHSTQDFGLALAGGLSGLRARLEAYAPEHPESADWYEAARINLEGVAGYIRAHAEALATAAASTSGRQRAEWRALAEGCLHVAEGAAPRCFLEAVQLFYFLFMLCGHDSPGRMDQYLWPALERDLEGDALTFAEAQEIVDCLYLKLAEHNCHGATLGGQLPEGGDATNTMTWLSLNSIRRLRLLSPRTALRWHQGTPEDLFAATVHSVATGATFPVFVNDEAMIPSLRRRGVREDHARDYTFCGCGQTTPSGRAYGGYEDLMLNCAKPLAYALRDGREERGGEQMGPRTGEAEALRDYAALEEAVWAQTEALLAAGIEATAAWRGWAAEWVPDPLRSLLTHSCVERGRDWRGGGADYHEGMADLVGLTTLADSLLAIRRVVYEERRVTLPELVAVLDRDWEGAEELWARCRFDVPKFGNEDPEADEKVRRWLARINDWLFAQRTLYGGPWGIDIVGWSGAVQFGALTGATPDGRRAGEPIADCAGPAQGRDRAGLTAVLNSMLKLPGREIHGPLALSLRVTEEVVRTPAGEAKLGAAVRSYFERGGQQLQITVASAETLRAAQRDPASYRDLIVRVGGFSAYFVELGPEFQEDMIRRTEHRLA